MEPTPDPRRAVVERREAVAAEPRPTPLHSTDVAEQVSAARDSDELYRLYRPEWQIVNVTSRLSDDPSDEAMLTAARAHFEDKYAGRVRDEDVRYVTSGSGRHALVQLHLRMPTLKGEFRYAFDAQRHAEANGWSQWDIVVRHSDADRRLRAYGVTKLKPGTATAAGAP